MKDLSGSEFTERQLKSNVPVVLTGSDRLWGVKSGAIAIFAVEIVAGVEQGERRYLFDLEPNEVLFGWPSQQGLTEQLLAVSYDDTTVISIDHWAENLGLTQLEAWLKQWSDRLHGVFVGTGLTLPELALVTGESVQEKLETFHLHFQDGLKQLRELETQANQRRFQERLQLNQQ